MADIPLFPDESNMARFQDFVNIQKEISEHLLAQKHLYEQIGRINRDTEDRIIKRRQAEFRMLRVIQDQNVKYNELVSRRGTLHGKEATELESQIDSTLQLIKHNRELIDLSKLASSVEMEMAKKQYEEGNRWFKFVSGEAQKITGLNFKQFEAVKATGDKMLLLGNVTEKMAYSVGSIVMMLTGAFDLFKKFDTAAWEFRKAMGMTRLESESIRKDVQRIAIDNMALGVTVDNVYKSYRVLGQLVGGVHNVTKSMAEDVSIMAAQLGISEVTSAGFLRNMAAISKSTMESQTAMMYIAKGMSNAAGVQLDQVMGDMATKSSKTLTMMSRLPNVVLRTAIELRRMGTDMDRAASSSRHILDFTENINEEMEASVLLGRSINLQRARELSYRRDLEGSTKEILRISKSINFENLDVFQQEAFARATGKSVDELLKMLQTNRQLETIRRSGTPEQRAQLAIYEKMRKENEAAAKARAKDISAELRRIGNQERLVQIQNKWNQLLSKAQEFLLPVVDKFLSGALAIIDWVPAMMAFSSSIRNAFTWLSRIVNLSDKFTLSLMIAARYGRSTMSISEKIFFWLSKIPLLGKSLSIFSKSFAFIGKYIGMFSKFLGPIGVIIMAFQFIGNLISRMKGIGDAFNKGFFNGLWVGLKSIVGALYDTLIKPFVDAFKYIWHFFGGKSPSLLGMGILNGIVSVGTMMFNAITMPYKMAFEWIINKFTSIGKFMGRLFGQGESIENKAVASYIPAVTVTPNGTEIIKPGKKDTANGKVNEKVSELMTEETGCKIVSLLEKILAKNNDLYVDGGLMSTTLARNIEFRGAFGTNR